MSETWQCRYCQHHSVFTGNYDWAAKLIKSRKRGQLQLEHDILQCGNPACQEIEIVARLHNGQMVKNGQNPEFQSSELIGQWQLLPRSKAKTLPTFIPGPVREDYEEACLIVDLSPKASATLSRRCLQGMIRDFWKVKPTRLFDEINAIAEKVDPTVWGAIDGLRQVGNIGAHMERDINEIVEVDPGEAQALIELLEILFAEWYIARADREKRVDRVAAIAAVKRADG